MNFPKRIKQHQAESDSYAILLYKLRKLGIFRNQTDNDYGIDFEIEPVKNGKITGNYIKAQVKSSEKLFIRKKDSVPTVGGIKQTTLIYWAELSYKTHVLAYAVDLSTEDIYLTRPLFWQAIRLMDNSDKTKTLEFIPNNSGKLGIEKLTLAFSNTPSLSEELFAHKTALKYLKSFFDLYSDVFHLDVGMELDDAETFSTLLEVGHVLFKLNPVEFSELSTEHRQNLFSERYWQKQHDEFGFETINYVARTPIKAIMPWLLGVLKDYENLFFESKYYWINKNLSYLKLVYDYPAPEVMSHSQICKFNYNENARLRADGGFQAFLTQ